MKIDYINHKNYKIAFRTWFNQNNDSNPILLFAHASGFHSMIWSEIIKNLTNYNCIAIDFSGHGESDNPELEYKWDQFSDELSSLIKLLDLNNIVGIGHSLGGYAVTHTTKNLLERFHGKKHTKFRKEMKKIIPIAGPSITKKEIDYVYDAIKNGWYENAFDYIKKFEKKFKKYVKRRYAISLPSCTSA